MLNSVLTHITRLYINTYKHYIIFFKNSILYKKLHEILNDKLARTHRKSNI